MRHDKNSAVAPGKPGSAIYPDSPLGEDIEGIPTGRDVEWQPLVVIVEMESLKPRFMVLLHGAMEMRSSIHAEEMFCVMVGR